MPKNLLRHCTDLLPYISLTGLKCLLSKGGVDLYFHTFVLWALDWGWIEQTLNSRQSPSGDQSFSLFFLSLTGMYHMLINGVHYESSEHFLSCVDGCVLVEMQKQ